VTAPDCAKGVLPPTGSRPPRCTATGKCADAAACCPAKGERRFGATTERAQGRGQQHGHVGVRHRLQQPIDDVDVALRRARGRGRRDERITLRGIGEPRAGARQRWQRRAGGARAIAQRQRHRCCVGGHRARRGPVPTPGVITS
jgi:hypothetical protein